MKRWGIVLLIFILAGCGTSSTNELPTLAVLPTLALTEETVQSRPTLPPTFTPTFTPQPPTETPLPPSITPTPTIEILPTSRIGSPLDSPSNFPVTMRISGGGFGFNAAPPSGVSYVLKNEVYTFTAQHITIDIEQVTIYIVMRNNLATGTYNPVACNGVGNGLPQDAIICISATYTNPDIVGVNTGGTVELASLEPLTLSAEIPLSVQVLPGRSKSRYTLDNSRINLTSEDQKQSY